jgi:hypothetical protein
MHAFDFRQALAGLGRISAATSAPEVLGILERALKPFGAEFLPQFLAGCAPKIRRRASGSQRSCRLDATLL